MAIGQDATATAGQFVLRAVLSLLIGVAIGAITGEYVTGRPVNVAAVVAGAYAALAIAAVVPGGASATELTEVGPDRIGHHSMWPDQPWLWLIGYVLIILITVPTAGLTAHRRTPLSTHEAFGAGSVGLGGEESTALGDGNQFGYEPNETRRENRTTLHTHGHEQQALRPQLRHTILSDPGGHPRGRSRSSAGRGVRG